MFGGLGWNGDQFIKEGLAEELSLELRKICKEKEPVKQITGKLIG